MEYPSKNDFFIRFKALINESGKFIDYVLVEVSDSFHLATGIKSDRVLGNKLSNMVIDLEESVLGLKDFYYHMIPGVRRKFEYYVEEEGRWYLVTIYSNKRDYLIMIYTDITRYKGGSNNINKIERNSKKQKNTAGKNVSNLDYKTGEIV